MRTRLWNVCFGGLWLILGCDSIAQSKTTPSDPASTSAIVLEMEGTVESMRKGAQKWDRSYTNQLLSAEDQLRTGPRSRAVLRMSNLTPIRLGELSHLTMPAPSREGRKLNLLRGVFYFLHRDRPGEYDLQTPTASAVVRGTEFNLRVLDDGTTTLSLFDGTVEMSNEFGKLSLQSDEQAVAEPGKTPAKTAILASSRPDIIQWSLYYPGVVDLHDLELSSEEKQSLGASLAAYQRGDLLQALAAYPPNRIPGTISERIYLAALFLAVGQIEQAETLLRSVPSDESRTVGPISGESFCARSLAQALRLVMAAVKFQPRPSPPSDPASSLLATEWLAESYFQQSRSSLGLALAAAEAAVKKSPGFAFAWARQAELEFAFGRISKTRELLEKSLQQAPRNAQALSLKGFVLAAENRWSEALKHFDQAMAVDGALGNAWLGRGLVRIQQGAVSAGREDLQVAALLEPQRALFRSYLGKAFNEENDVSHAVGELAMAKQLDPNDPTSWLYSALLNRQENRVNEAVRELERSRALNDNRSVFRSRLLLDQDRAVRSANLAAIYQEAGMLEVAAREASRAVGSDYASFSAHLFLADSYAAFLDPRQANLRFETPTVSEYLVANLLAPVSSGLLSPNISQQEYSRLFERNRLGIISGTEYSSRGDWLQYGSQFGVFNDVSYALDFYYRSQNGQRRNEDLEQRQFSPKLKIQLSPKDSLYLEAVDFHNDSGDVSQNYFNRPGRLRLRESQEPILLLGYHREWAPGIHTLFLGGRLIDTAQWHNPEQPVLLLGSNEAGRVVYAAQPGLPSAPLQYRTDLEIYTAELQQVWHREKHSFILGARYQNGVFDQVSRLGESDQTHVGTTTNVLSLSLPGVPDISVPYLVSTPALTQEISSDFERFSLYAYQHWQIAPVLLLTAGISYDQLGFPINHRSPPISDRNESRDKVSPKAGFVWDLSPHSRLRGSFTRSIGGVSFDQSFKLEPTQVGGFNQAYRSLISESVVGPAAAPEFETFGVGLDHRFRSGTYLGIDAELHHSTLERAVGTFQDAVPNPLPASTPQHLDYEEKDLLVNLNQLLGQHWAVGARYCLSDSDLSLDFPEVPRPVMAGAHVDAASTLHQLQLSALFHHPRGFFARWESLWTAQSNRRDVSSLSGDDFWQHNLFGGYRFRRRALELKLGLLNLAGSDYQLYPLNFYAELPRKRTLILSAKFSF